MELIDFKPIPVYKNTLDYSLSVEEKKKLSSLKISESLLSEEMHLLDDEVFSSLKNKIMRHVKEYATTVCSFDERIKFRMTESWYRKTKTGKDHPIHNHPNSVLSGVYYVSVPDGNNHDTINFFSEESFFKNFQFQWQPLKYNKYNSNHLQLPVKSDIIVLFPSWMNHYVTTNISLKECREVISFNCFPSGIFDIDNLFPTHLKL